MVWPWPAPRDPMAAPPPGWEQNGEKKAKVTTTLTRRIYKNKGIPRATLTARCPARSQPRFPSPPGKPPQTPAWHQWRQIPQVLGQFRSASPAVSLPGFPGESTPSQPDLGQQAEICSSWSRAGTAAGHQCRWSCLKPVWRERVRKGTKRCQVWLCLCKSPRDTTLPLPSPQS